MFGGGIELSNRNCGNGINRHTRRHGRSGTVKADLNAKRSRALLALALGVVVSELLPVASPVAMGDATWVGGTSQDFNNGANWSVNPPSGNFLINTSTGNFPVLTANSLYTSVDFVLGNGGTNSGRFDQRAGSFATGSGNWFFVGRGSNTATGIYNLADTSVTGTGISGYGEGSGSMTAGKLWVGGAFFNDDGVGTVNINTTGTITTNSTQDFGNGSTASLILGEAYNGGTCSGTINLENGTINATGQLCDGLSGTGVFNQSGGTVNNTDYFVIGRNTGAAGGFVNGNGTYNLSGGTVNAATSTGYATLASFTGSTGVLNVSGGLFNTSHGGLAVGEGGTGTLNVSGTGVVNLGNANYLNLGLNSGAVGTVNLNGGLVEATAVAQGSGSGTLNFNGGTLQPTVSNTNFITGLNSANVLAGGAVLNSNGFNITVAQPLLHGGIGTDGGLTKNGSGTLTLTGSSNYTGNTNVSAGTLLLSGTSSINSSGTIAVNGSGAKFVQTSSTAVSAPVHVSVGTLDGTGTVNTVNVDNSASAVIANGNGGTAALTVGSLTFSGAATLNLNISGTTPATPVLATTTLTTAGTADEVININNAFGAYTNGNLNGDGTYDLIHYTGSIGGGGAAAFSLAPVSGLGGRQSASLSFPAGYVALLISGVNPTWTGLNNGNWTTAVQSPNKNWVANGGTDFMPGDIVTFDDSATGTTNVTISDANVTPTSVLVNNTTKSYSIAGPFGIADYTSPTQLIKNGTGTVSISAPDSYSGGTILNAGTLNINSATAIGTGTLTIAGGNIDNTSTTPITITTNNPQNWNSDFTFGGSYPLNLGTGTVSMSASRIVTVNGTGALTIGGNISGSNDAVTKAGTGTLVLAGSSTYTGATTVNAGTLSVTGTLASSPTMNVNNGSLLQVSGTVSNTTTNDNNGTLDVSGTYTSSGNLWIAQGNGNSGTLTVESTGTVNAGVLLIGAGGTPTAVANGTGTLASGGTINTQEWFVLAQSGASPSSGSFTVNGGTINVHTVAADPGNLEVSTFDPTTATLNINAGSNINLLNNASIAFGAQSNQTGTGTVNQNGGNVTFYSDGGTIVGGTGSTILGTAGTGTYTYNLNGGTLTTPSVSRSTGTGIFNFNGGTLKAAGNSTTFMQGLSSANVQATGAVIDDGGHTITIAQPLLHATALGATPDGGLTKLGSGVLTLTSASTYTGGTAIQAGTLRLGTAGAPAALVAGYSFDNTTTTPVEPDPTAQFTIHSSVGGSALDGTANSNSSSGVTIVSGGPSNFNGGNGNSLHFDGTGGFVNIINSITDLGGSGNWTVSLWEQTNSPTSQGGTFLSKDSDGTWEPGNSIFYLGDGSGTGAGYFPTAVRNTGGFLSTNTNVTDGTWHMVTFVGNSGTRSIYVDGVLTTLSQAGFGNGNTTPSDIGDLVQLGYTPDTVSGDGTNPLYGNLDDINFYNGALSATQISSLYATNLINLPTPATNYLPATTAVNITTSGATLDLYGSAQRIGSLTGVAGSVVALGGGTLYVGGNNSSTAFPGNITDAGGGSSSTGGNLVKEGTGTLILSGTNAYSGLTEVTAGSLALESTTALPAASTLAISSGATVVVNRNGAGRITLDLNSLSNSGLIDLQNNRMVIHNSTQAAADATTAAVFTQLQNGFAGGGWNGTSGIVSTSPNGAAGSSLYTLGEVESGTDVLVRYAYYGDADLSGTVDGTDYSLIDTGFASQGGPNPLTGWQNGDFNYDGHIDGSDYSLIDNAFNMQTGSAPAVQIASNTSEIVGGSAAVPEPASLSLFGIAATALLGRRRRRHRM
jgi:fibronectin-binding autotransporter adhesin